MKKICVIGAGISGLSIARLLNESAFVEVLEKDSVPGGIAKTQVFNDVAYHLVGGHCFNSKDKSVSDFVFNKIMSKNLWHKIERNSNVLFGDMNIKYPIEYSIRQIYEYDKDKAIRILSEIIQTKAPTSKMALDEWFRCKFGNTLAEEYFIPYNKKIWQTDLSSVASDWVKDKLPTPNVYDIFDSLFEGKKDFMPHSEFYYPNTNNQQTFIDALAMGVNIKYTYEVESICYDPVRGKWIVNSMMEYDYIVSTMPLIELVNILCCVPSEVIESSKKLKYNSITNMLWTTTGTDNTWTYLPNKDTLYHRYIHIGNFYNKHKNYTISESIGNITKNEMVNCGKKDPFLLEPIGYNYSKYAYVVFDNNHQKSVSVIMNYLTQNKIYTIGRFGEWQYYNMDICIKRSMAMAKYIIQEQEMC